MKKLMNLQGMTRIDQSLSKGICPFCKDAVFYATENEFICLACGKKGNRNTFQYLSGKEFAEVPEKDTVLLNIYNETAKWYFLNMKNFSKETYSYYRKRGLSDHTIKSFGLGYSPKYGLEKHLKTKGFQEEDILRSQLVCEADNGKHYDFFRNRAMIPIFDEDNNVVAFGGRTMGNEKAKYINSRDYELFNKSNMLFGYNFAKKSGRVGIICCEGYMDVISMHQYGFDNSVASLGTSFTINQARLIANYTNRVWLAYDSDEAGQKATLKNLSMLRKVGINAKVIQLNPYKDPDDFLQNAGTVEFEKRIYASQDGILYELDTMIKEHKSKDEMAEFLFPLLTTMEEVEYYIGYINNKEDYL